MCLSGWPIIHKHMMHINFNPEKIDWDVLLKSARLKGPEGDFAFQFGGGSYTIFHGTPYQRGAGIGALFKSLIRYLVPIGKNIGTAIGRQGLETGSKILSGVLEGKALKDALKEEGQTGLQSLLQKAATSLERQKGEGRRRKRKRATTTPRKKTINKSKPRGKKTTKRRKLFSTIGPPLFPSKKPNKKKHSGIKKFHKTPKRLRFDALGPF
jgi:hypothetical protein